MRNSFKIGLLLSSIVFLAGVVITLQAQDTAGDNAVPQPQVTIIAEGLYNPVGMALLPNGNLLIAEEGTGNDDLSAGVSMMLPDGTIGRLISGFPSGRDSGDLSGVPFVSVSPDGETIYTAHFNGMHLWTLPADQADTLPETPFSPDDMGVAMERFNNVLLVNPFDMTYNADGVPIVSDATNNGVAIELPDGRTRFFHRFEELQDPADEMRTIQAVPTGITRVDDEYYVALFGGCPYPANSGEIVAIDEERNQRTILDNLSMPIDVVMTEEGRLWVLEFARFSADGSCFSGSGYRPESGRLSYLNDDGELVTILDDLDFPGAVLPMPDGSLYITQIFDGQLLHITFDETINTTRSRYIMPEVVVSQPVYRTIDDPDAVLADVIAREGLVANPGQMIPQPDAELAQLGHDLFFDPILSGDRNISCATCHHPALAMGDARVLPIGTGGVGLAENRVYREYVQISEDVRRLESGQVPNPFFGDLVPRNSPTILNSAMMRSQFWDGRVETYALGHEVMSLDPNVNVLNLTDVLITQALFPITSVHEMAGATFGGEAPQHIRIQLAQRLNAHPEYSQRFSEVFGVEQVEPIHIVSALGAFERQMIFTQAPWDDYIAGDTDALTPEQKRGALLFYGELNEAVNCAVCHQGDAFSDMQFHNLLVPQIGPGKGNGVTGREDYGRANVTFDYRDQYRFRTAPLRNVALTAPYFHTGAYQTLEDAIWHHANIIESAQNYDPASHLPPAYYSSTLPFSWERQGHTASPLLLNGLPLTEQDVSDLIAFLHTLTDPNAVDLSAFQPDETVSGLALDPIPTELVTVPQTSRRAVNNVATPDEALTGDWHFVNVAPALGIDFQQGAFATDIFEDPAAMMGAGLCWIDYDNDGWLDLYLVNSHAEDERAYWEEQGGLPINRLYRNDQGQGFVDVSADTRTDLALRGNGCVVADFDNNGWDDIFVTADDPNALLLNQGDGTFIEVGAQAGIDAPEWNSAAAVADLNGDGWLDLFVGSYIDLDYQVPNPVGAFPQDYYGIPDRLYLSEGLNADGIPTFTEITREVGLQIDERTLGAIFTDLDNDGDLDLYLANDGQPNRLYQYQPADNRYGFVLVDTYETSGVNDRGSGMGVASGDWTGDGWFDLVVTNWDRELNAIYRNSTQEIGDLNFAYSTYRIGMTGFGNNMTGWGVHFADFDHDTDLDMLTVNGRVPVVNFANDAEQVRLYGNRQVEGYAGQFREWSQHVGLDDLGLLMARGSALADFDNDGDLDIAINTIGGQAVLLRNHAPQGNWLMVDTGSSRPGLRAELTLSDGTILQRELHVGSSYLASEDPRLHFGLGDHTQITSLTITLPDGTVNTYENVSVNEMLVIE